MDAMSEQQQAIERLKFDSRNAIVNVAETIASVEVDFDSAGEFLAKSPGIGPRSETDFPQLESLSDEQQKRIRSEAAKIGIGASESVDLEKAGLPEGTTVILEGGLPNKMLAQLEMATNGNRQPGVIVMTASKTRKAGDADAKRISQVSGVLGKETPNVEGKTEFEMAEITAGLLGGFISSEPEDLDFGYDIFDGGIRIRREATGQVKKIGEVNGSPVVVAGVSEFHRDDTGRNFYRPSAFTFGELAEGIATELGGAEESPVAVVTSHLYGPSRRLMNPNTLTYGTKVMEEVVGEQAAEPTIQNIVSELQRTYEILNQPKE